MNKDFLHYYNLELQHLREMSGEFAKANPKMAGRLSMDEFSCEDPYVERLLEGFSYLAARVHQKLDAGYPRLSQALLDNLFPDYLMPIPSMGIVRFDPDYSETVLADGIRIKKGTKLRSISGRGIRSCQFVTTQDITLWPVEISDAKYYTDDMSYMKIDYSEKAKSCLCLGLDTLTGCNFSELNMNSIDLYLRNSNQLVNLETFELMLSKCRKIIIQPKDKRKIAGQVILDNSKNDLITPIGFEKDHTLFPYEQKTFEGYRLLRKYFTMQQSFMFLRIGGLTDVLKNMDVDKINLIMVFDSEVKRLKESIKKTNFSLYCTPVVNLFKKTLSRIHLDNSKSGFHVVGERTESQDFEIMKINSVKGFKIADNEGQVFSPMYSATGFFDNNAINKAYYSLNRIARTLTEQERESGTRTNYSGTETYISLVDQYNAPYNGNIVDLEIKALCSNRDLPLLIPVGYDYTDFTFDSNIPVTSIKFVHGPTNPYCDHIFNSQWEVINHISLNYLTLKDEKGVQTGEILRNIMNLYTVNDLQRKLTVKELKKVKIRPDTMRYNQNGMFTFINGFDIELFFDDSASGNDAYLLAMIFDRFFEFTAPINSFTRTSLITEKRGKVEEWPARTGTFQMI